MRNHLLGPSLRKCSFLITFLFENGMKSSLGPLPPQVFISYYILTYNAWEIISWAPPSSSAHFLLHSYLKIMKNHLLGSSLLKCSFLITLVFEYQRGGHLNVTIESTKNYKSSINPIKGRSIWGGWAYIYTRRKDGAKAPSLLDHFGHSDAKAKRQTAPSTWHSAPSTNFSVQRPRPWKSYRKLTI